jgi:branched-chain amino acid transport system substrate-binding protein
VVELAHCRVIDRNQRVGDLHQALVDAVCLCVADFGFRHRVETPESISQRIDFGSQPAEIELIASGFLKLIDSLPEDERPQRVGVLTEQNPFPLIVRDGLEGEAGVIGYAEERGMEVVFNEEYTADTTDFSSLIERARAADVEAFFAASLPVPGGLIARTIYDVGFEPMIYCACGSQITSLPYWPDLGPAGEGVMSTHMALPSDDYPGLVDLYEHLRDELGAEELSTYGPVAMAILQVLEQAVEATGSLDQNELYEYVTTTGEFETVNGPMRYNEHGIPDYNAVGVQVLDGTNVIVWPPERATGEAVIPIPRS